MYTHTCTQAALTFAPLGPPPAWACAFINFACAAAEHYFPARVIVEDEGALRRDKPYVIGEQAHYRSSELA